MMNKRDTAIPGVQIITPNVFADKRGYFYEIFRKYEFPEFVQDNIVCSNQRVLRGLHYQPEHPQGKLMMAVVGTIFEVAVDVRPGSPTFGQWVGSKLDSISCEIMYIAPGFLTGTLSMTDRSVLLYKATDYYDPDNSVIVAWDDPDLNIAWPMDFPVLKDEDANGRSFKEVFGDR
jgi:dTDP-4-dehydrorhamnose 3,5-epimerase